ncbi:hypothetical protein K3X41_04385 [Aliiroseovarius crassostreae]|nr:hypothetical protein [Aliiroseovarius crassostreae]UWQ11931.1 hypothetical protein K3X41_04385 [Aliiroseovarius crassostreae]
MTHRDEIKSAFESAVRFAIEQMGEAKFKETSFFGSNDAPNVELKKAA